MTVPIKYTVKYRQGLAVRISKYFIGVGCVILLIIGFLYAPFTVTHDIEVLANLFVIPELFWDISATGTLLLGLGIVSRSVFKWRRGKIEINDERLLIDGSLNVSIWMSNILTIDFQDTIFINRTILIDSKTDAVKLRFRNRKEFDDFSERLIQCVEPFDSVKIRTQTAD